MSNFDEKFFKDLLKEEREECLKGPGIDLELHEAFVEACQSFQDAKEAKEAADTDLAEINGAEFMPAPQRRAARHNAPRAHQTF